jgi:thiamine biosynthesis lipoprotein
VISGETRALITYGIDLYRRTRGVFNILTGHILEARGYDGAYSFIDKGSDTLTPGNPLTDIVMMEERVELRYGNIDIGGFGKGWLIDALARELRDQFGLTQFLINGGGDMYATHQNDEPVEIYLEDPLQPGTIVGTTYLRDQAFAASSPHKRRWPDSRPEASGADQYHIVSSTKVKDVIYLIAPNATDADAFAKTLLQLSEVEAREVAKENYLTLVQNNVLCI